MTMRMSTCWIMCIQKRSSEYVSMGETRASSISTMPPAKAAGRQREKWKRRAPGAAGSAAAAARSRR